VLKLSEDESINQQS
jgi:hypothetical protein